MRKERIIKLNLSDGDWCDLVKLAGMHNLTADKLLENFVNDLVYGDHTNGSDERMYAEMWFKRCWFGMFPEETLLRHLLTGNCDVEDFLDAWDEKVYAEAHPEEYENERADLMEGDLLWFEEDVESFLYDWNPDDGVNMDEEIARCRKYLEEYNK